MPENSNALRIPETLLKVKSLIGVFSAKGGVGKSMISLNLAKSLNALGHKVGLVDGDIYGPSQAIMLNVAEKTVEVKDQKMLKPLMVDGISFMSMGLISSDRMPVIWRGPMVSGAIMQLLSQTEWGSLDYLIIDTPPGTGDIQLTLMQRLPLTAAIVVTTPEEVSISDTRKGIEMINKLSIPILGLVENMSYFNCNNCDERHYIFGKGGGQKLATEYNLDLLTSFPLLNSDENKNILQNSICKENFAKLAESVRQEIGNLRTTQSEEIPQTTLK